MRKIMYIACLLGLLTFSACGKTGSTNVDNMNKQENATDNSMNDVQIEEKHEQSADVLEPVAALEDNAKEAQEETEVLDYEIIKVAETVIDKTQYDFWSDWEEEIYVSFIVRVNDNWKKENGINGGGVDVEAGFPLEEGEKSNVGLDATVGGSLKCIQLSGARLKDADGVTTAVKSYVISAEYLETFEMHFLKTNSSGNVIEGYIPAELPSEVSDIPERYILRGEYNAYPDRIPTGYIVYLENNPYLITDESIGDGGRNVNDEYYEYIKKIELTPVDVTKILTSDFTGMQMQLPDEEEIRENVQERIANENLDMDKIRQEMKLYSAKEARENGWTFVSDNSQIYAISFIYDYNNIAGFEGYTKILGNELTEMISSYQYNATLIYENSEDSFSISY